MKRRREMEKEIERNERERLMTARPEDLVEYLPSPVTLELNLVSWGSLFQPMSVCLLTLHVCMYVCMYVCILI